MKAFVYCPSCRGDLRAPDEHRASVCSDCGRSWYRNPAPTVGCAIVRDGQALVSVRARDPEKGRVDVPGGFVDPGEDLLTALRREVREELGVEIDVSQRDFLHGMPHRYGDSGDWVLALGFRARLASGEPSASDDVAEVLWVRAAELDAVDFAWEHDRRLVRDALEAEGS